MFEEFFNKIGFKPQKVFRPGPRVYVVGGWCCPRRARLQFAGANDGRRRSAPGAPRLRRAVFKSAFKKEVRLSEKLRREAVFLAGVPKYLAPHLPKVFNFGQLKRGQFWYLAEWVWPGKSQSVGDSNFLMESKFFTQKNLNWALKVLSGLRRFSANPPQPIKKELSATVYDLKSYRRLLEPQGRKFFDLATWERVKNFLDQAAPIYNRVNRTTITHHEFYGSQILSSGRSLKLTDWENVGWGHPLRDFTTLWIRAFEHPAWQKRFLKGFKESLRLNEKDFGILFGVEKILQNFGNLVLFDQTELKEERRVKREAMEFFRQCILDVL